MWFGRASRADKKLSRCTADRRDPDTHCIRVKKTRDTVDFTRPRLEPRSANRGEIMLASAKRFKSTQIVFRELKRGVCKK